MCFLSKLLVVAPTSPQIDAPSDGADDNRAGDGGAASSSAYGGGEGGGGEGGGGQGQGQGQPAGMSTISFDAADEQRQQDQGKGVISRKDWALNPELYPTPLAQRAWQEEEQGS